MLRKTVGTLVLVLAMMSCMTTAEPDLSIDNPSNAVILKSDIDWEQLNPARGDASPLAGTIWGDRQNTVATGYLGQFVDGFSSPPHIHNVTYRAVVIEGSLHNDDPEAANLWMPPGSFWTQPAGEAHITSAKGEKNIAYIEIDKGPYLVWPTDEAFDNGEKPINIVPSNIQWLDSSKSRWVEAGGSAEISYLWHSDWNGGVRGLFVKVPEDFIGEMLTYGSVLYAVLIQGSVNYIMPDGKYVSMTPGDCFTSTEKALHSFKNISSGDVILYIRTNDELTVFEDM